MEKEWNNISIKGKGDFVLKEKLRILKDKLRVWNREVFGMYDLEVDEGVRDSNMADGRLEWDCDLAFLETLKNRKEASRRIWRNFRIKKMLIQKSRLKWIKEGG